MIAQLLGQVLEVQKATQQATHPCSQGAFVSRWADRRQTHVLGGDGHHFENKTAG